MSKYIMIARMGEPGETFNTGEKCSWPYSRIVLNEKNRNEFNVQPFRHPEYGLGWKGRDPIAGFAFFYEEPSMLEQEIFAAQHFGFGKKKKKG